MINSISAEFLKLRRRKMFLITIVVYSILIFMYIKNMFGGIQGFPFYYLYISTFPIAFMLQILFLSFLAVTIFGDDYKTGMIRQITTIPMSMMQYFLTKISVVLVFSFALSFIVFFEMIAVSLYYHCPGLSFASAAIVFLFCILFAVTCVIAMIPLFFIMVIAKQNIILPVMSAIFYVSIVLLPSMGIIHLYGIGEFVTKYFYPPGSLILIFNELFYQILPAKSLELLKPDDNILFCILSLLFYFIGLTFVSVQILNKQEN